MLISYSHICNTELNVILTRPTNQGVLEWEQRLQPVQRLLVLPPLTGVRCSAVGGQPALILSPAELQTLERLAQLAAEQGRDPAPRLGRRLTAGLL